MQKISVIALIMILTSCASFPANFGPPSPSSKIGFLLLIDEYPKHNHVGTTIFQNSENNESSKTNFKEKYYEKMAETLSIKNYELVKLKDNQTLYDKRFSLYPYSSGYFKKSVKSNFDKLATANSLDFIIVVFPLNGPAWPNSSAYIDGYGLYTSCKFNNCVAEALDHVSARIYDVKNQSGLKQMRGKYFDRPAVPEIDLSKGVKSITSEEIDLAAHKALEKFMGQFTDMVRASGFVD